MKSYEAWLKETEDILATAIMEAEDEGWHHESDQTPGGRVYARLLTWLAAIEERRSWSDAAKRN